jgi:putative exosortase-associated protein (TIGR04073 family)
MTAFYKKTALILVFGILFGSSGYAAYDYRFDSKEDLKGQFESSAGEKLTRGLTNVLFGWMEIARTPAERAAGIEHGKVNAFLLGVPHGIMRFAGRTVVGAYEIVTCYAPQSPIMPNLPGEVL